MQLHHLGQWPFMTVQTVFEVCLWLKASDVPSLSRTTWSDLIGTSMASIARSAVVMGAEVDGLAAKGAAVVDQRLVLLDSHGWIARRCESNGII